MLEFGKEAEPDKGVCQEVAGENHLDILVDDIGISNEDKGNNGAEGLIVEQ